MAKRIIFTIAGLLLLIGALASTKITQFKAMAAQSMKMPAAVVATAEVRAESWQPTFEAVGTVVPVRGVELHAESAGLVQRIYFDSGAFVKAGNVIAQLDTAVERSQLVSAEASAELGRTQFERVQSLQGSAAVAASEVDRTTAQNKQADAELGRLRAQVDKRTIRAPFNGNLGIWKFTLGHFLNLGDPVNTVVDLTAVYVDFGLPQQRLGSLQPGMVVRVTSDAYPKRSFEGKLSVINPTIDVATRNLYLRASFDNPEKLLRPGMYTHVEVVLPETRSVIVVPVTAVIYAPYGDSVFVVEKKADELSARQQFVRLGLSRGDFVEISEGLKAGQTVVTTGAFKLRNDMPIKVNNELLPKVSLTPTPSDG